MININLLPKTLIRKREPAHWKLIAILLPILVLGSIFTLQVLTNLQERSLKQEKNELELTRREMQKHLDEFNTLKTRKADLQELLAIRDSVKDDYIVWSDEIALMLETLPAPTTSLPSIAFDDLNIRALDARERDKLMSDQTYEGLEAGAEMEISGRALDSQALASYLRRLQDSPIFGVAFKDASLDEETGSYKFDISVGAIAKGKPESLIDTRARDTEAEEEETGNRSTIGTVVSSSRRLASRNSDTAAAIDEGQ